MRLEEHKLYVEVNICVSLGMYDISESYPHKEKVVDLSALPHTPNASINLNFVAKDLSGSVITTKAVKIPLRP
jgi:hypothetical protein